MNKNSPPIQELEEFTDVRVFNWNQAALSICFYLPLSSPCSSPTRTTGSSVSFFFFTFFRHRDRLMDMERGEERERCMEKVTWKLTLPYVK